MYLVTACNCKKGFDPNCTGFMGSASYNGGKHVTYEEATSPEMIANTEQILAELREYNDAAAGNKKGAGMRPPPIPFRVDDVGQTGDPCSRCGGDGRQPTRYVDQYDAAKDTVVSVEQTA